MDNKLNLDVILANNNPEIIWSLLKPKKLLIDVGGIYVIINLINGKLYFGSSIHCYQRMFEEHFGKLKRNCHGNEFLQNSYNKYGKENFKGFFIFTCSRENLIKYEDFYIDLYHTLDRRFGYNIEKPDRNIISNQTKEKIRKTLTGRKLSEEHKKNIVQSGEKNGFYGKRHSEESKKKMSESHLGKIITQESIKKGKETRKRNNKPYHKISPENLKKMLDSVIKANSKAIFKISNNNEILEEFISVKSAAESIGVTPSRISASCRLNEKAGGFRWKYKN